MQKLQDIIVVESLPLATCPADTVFPACWTMASGLYALQVTTHTLQDIQGLPLAEAQRPLYKPWLPAGNTTASPLHLITANFLQWAC